METRLESKDKINWEVLAVLRFFLASIVMVGHLQEYSDVGVLKWFSYLGSFEAILGFLLISGLSIGKSISRDQSFYYKRRAQRIYPVYLASMVLQLVFSKGLFNLPFVLTVIANILFLNHIVTSTSFVGVSWTLAVEVWLYALAPFFLKLSSKKLYYLIGISFVLYCLYTCGRTLFHWDYYSGTSYGINLLFLAFAWLCGFALAIFPNNKLFTSRLIAVLFLGHWLLGTLIQILYRYKNDKLDLVFSTDILPFVGHLSCLVLVYLLVIFNYRIPKFSLLTSKLFKILGDISYPLYLIHCTVFLLLNNWGYSDPIILILCAIAVSFLIYYMFDFYSKKRSVKNEGEPSRNESVDLVDVDSKSLQV